MKVELSCGSSLEKFVKLNWFLLVAGASSYFLRASRFPNVLCTWFSSAVSFLALASNERLPPPLPSALGGHEILRGTAGEGGKKRKVWGKGKPFVVPRPELFFTIGSPFGL